MDEGRFILARLEPVTSRLFLWRAHYYAEQESGRGQLSQGFHTSARHNYLLFISSRFVEGELVSSTYERPNGKGKKSATTKITSWSIRADVVRKLDRGEPQPETDPVAEAAAPGEMPF